MQPRSQQDAKTPLGRQNVANKPKCQQDTRTLRGQQNATWMCVKTLPGCHKDARVPLGHCQDTWMSPGCQQNAARMPIVSKKLLILTK